MNEQAPDPSAWQITLRFSLTVWGKNASFYSRRSCTQLLTIKSSTCRRGPGVGGPFSLDIITPRMGMFPLLGFPLHRVIVTWCGLGCGWVVWGERQVWWVPWDPSVVSEQTGGTLWSLLLCWDLYPCPTSLTPFQDWILLCVEMAIPSWA